jgi:predicted sugar kinase
MAAFNKFNQFVADMANKVHNLGTDTLKVMLTNSAPVATNTNYSQLTDLATGGGYTAGGASVTGQSSTQTSGVEKLLGSLASPTWTATGSGFGPFRYAVIYNSTAGGNLIGYWDNGSAVTLAATQTFTVALDSTNGILQVS